MAKGLPRRAVSETNASRSLDAMATIEPVRLPATPGATRRQTIDIGATLDIAGSITKGLADFINPRVLQAQKADQEASMLDGAMAQAQGVTFQEIEMGGDKWALEGYRVVQAQEMSSSLLTAQRSELINGDYQLSPDEFRAKFVNRAEQVLAGVTDGVVAEMARAQMMGQMGVLVEEQMVQHLEWKENENFATLERAVDGISLDPTANDTLIAFAKGEPGTATAGLARDRRETAVASGIIRAFENGNPNAYGIIAGAGLLDGYSTNQRRMIENAKTAFENRQRREYDEEYSNKRRELYEQVGLGKLTPDAAVQELAQMMEDRNINMTDQEAGVIYNSAEQGTRDANLLKGDLIEQATLRGDTFAAADLIIDMLVPSESSGRTDADRINKDGRRFSGLLQIGEARLTDYNRANGKNVTLKQLRAMTAGEQREIGRWHIADILLHIDQKGFDRLIGTQINGVTVTRAGLVAVAHLGGKTGLNNFIATNGTYNKVDELGTSLTDYLAKFGAGEQERFRTPAQSAAAVKARIAELRGRAALDAYEAAIPLYRDADKLYAAGGSREDWIKTRADIREMFDVDKSKADVDYENTVTDKLKTLANDQLNERDALQSGVAFDDANRRFAEVVEAFGEGTGTQADIISATKRLQAERKLIQSKFGIALDAQDELDSLDNQVQTLRDAMDKRAIYDEGTVSISAAIASGTLDEMPKGLRDRAVREMKEQVANTVQDAIAVQGLNEDQAGDMSSGMMLEFYAQAGVVDVDLQRVLTGFLRAGALDKDRNVRPQYLEAVDQYRTLRNLNSALADRWFKPELRNDMDAIIDMSGHGSLEEAALSVGQRVSQAPDLLRIQEALNSSATAERIEDVINDLFASEDVGLFQALKSTADLSQFRDVSGADMFQIDREANRNVFTTRLRTEFEKQYKVSPHLAPSELMGSIAKRVLDRTPIIGGFAVELPMDGQTAGELFFGSKARDYTDQDAVFQAVVMDWLRSDEFQAEHPEITGFTTQELLPDFLPDFIRGEDTPNTKIVDQVLRTGVRPVQMYWNNVTSKLSMIILLPNGGYSEPIDIDTRARGADYMRKHTAQAATN